MPVRWLQGARSKRRIALVSLAMFVVVAAAGWLAAQQIRSPAQVAADAAAPAASPITVPVERRTLSTKVIVRGTVRFGGRRTVELGMSAHRTAGSEIVTTPARRRDAADAGDVGLSVDGRPVFVLPGAVSMHRDLRRGSRGPDVGQLEVALAGLGLSPGAVDGRFDARDAGRGGSAFYIDTRRTSRSGRRTPSSSSCGPPRRTPRPRATPPSRPAAPSSRHAAERRPATWSRRGSTSRPRSTSSTPRELGRHGGAQARLETARRPPQRPAPRETARRRNTRREQAAADADVAAKQEALALAVEEERLAAARPQRRPARRASQRARGGVGRGRDRRAGRRAGPGRARRGDRDGGRRPRGHARHGAPGPAARPRTWRPDARLAAAELRRAHRAVAVARRQVRLRSPRAAPSPDP